MLASLPRPRLWAWTAKSGPRHAPGRLFRGSRSTCDAGEGRAVSKTLTRLAPLADLSREQRERCTGFQSDRKYSRMQTAWRNVGQTSNHSCRTPTLACRSAGVP
jgi:hypothetical protein